MKLRFIITFLLISINFIFSQEKKVQLRENEFLTIDNPVNGKIEKGFYICNKFNWKIPIPENYKVIDPKQIEEMEKKGNAVKNEKNTHLVGFNLDAQNLFSSSYNSLDSTKKKSLDEHQKMFIATLNQAFSAIKNAKFELKTSNVKLGKYQFYKIKVEAYDANNKKLILTQIYYNSFINDYLFSVLISYNDEKQGKLLDNNFLNSM